MSQSPDLKDTFTDFANTPAEEYSTNRQEKLDLFQSLLAKENLEEFGKGDLRQLVRNLWAYLGWTNKDYIINEMLEDGIENVRTSLSRALYEEESPGEQFEALEENIKMMGPAAASEILAFIYPDRCAIYNRRAREAIEYLGYEDDLPNSISDGGSYMEFIEILDELWDNIQELDVDEPRSGKVRNYIDLDYFLFHVSEIEEEEEEEAPDEFEFDHDTIQGKLLEIGDGLGFDVEDEYDAGPRAQIDVRWSTRVANLGVISYAFEVHHKGSPDSAILNLKKAEAADPSVQKSVIVSEPEQNEKFKEEIEAMGGDFACNVSYLTAQEVIEAEELLSDLKSFLRQAGLMDELAN